MSDDERDRLVYHKFYLDRVKIFKETLTPEQMGRLFYAIFDYLDTGTPAPAEEIGADLAIIYRLECAGVDRAQAKHHKVALEREKAGRRGGQAKAKYTAKAQEAQAGAAAPPADGTANAAGTTSKTPPRPVYKPSMQEACKIISDILHDYSYRDGDTTPTKTDRQFLETLRQNGWCLEGYPLNEHAMWVMLLTTYFDDEYSKRPDAKLRDNAERAKMASHKKAFLAFWRASRGWSLIPDGIDPKDVTNAPGWITRHDDAPATWDDIWQFYWDAYQQFEDSYERVPVENPGTHRTTWLDNWRVGDKLYTADDGAKAYLDWWLYLTPGERRAWCKQDVNT